MATGRNGAGTERDGPGTDRDSLDGLSSAMVPGAKHLTVLRSFFDTYKTDTNG